MKQRYLLLTLIFATLMAHAGDLTERIRAQLAAPRVLQGQFEQDKRVAGFNQPLHSSGDFLVARDKGVLWATRKPFANQLKLTREQIVATQNGRIAFQLSARNEPSVRIINSLLFSLLSGDITALSQPFKVSGQARQQGWQIELAPRSASLGKVIKHIQLQGDQFVRTIRIDEANGDSTRIVFSAQTARQTPLSAEENAQFD